MKHAERVLVRQEIDGAMVCIVGVAQKLSRNDLEVLQASLLDNIDESDDALFVFLLRVARERLAQLMDERRRQGRISGAIKRYSLRRITLDEAIVECADIFALLKDELLQLPDIMDYVENSDDP